MQWPEQKEAGGLFNRSRINAKPHHWLHCSLTHTHSCREKKEGILTGPAWLGTQFQNLGEKQRKKKGKKCEAQRNLETHPKQPCMDRVSGKKKEKGREGGDCWWEAVIPSKVILVTYNVRNSKSYIMNYGISSTMANQQLPSTKKPSTMLKNATVGRLKETLDSATRGSRQPLCWQCYYHRSSYCRERWWKDDELRMEGRMFSYHFSKPGS